MVIHAFDDKEKFIAARIFQVFANVDTLDRLTLALSELHKTCRLEDVEEKRVDYDIWKIMGDFCCRFPGIHYAHTLRVMSIVPLQ